MGRAGQPFTSADAAATAAIDDINPTSISRNVEFAGRIFRRANGAYSFTAPGTLNRSDDSDAGPKVAGAANIGTYHTHAGGFNETDEIFSPQDLLKATLAKELSYLGTPHQRVLKFTPIDLLSKQEQATYPTGKVDVLRNIWVLKEITIVGDPNAPDYESATLVPWGTEGRARSRSTTPQGLLLTWRHALCGTILFHFGTSRPGVSGPVPEGRSKAIDGGPATMVLSPQVG
jgi:Domain of unknown function (DUF4329)